MTQTQNCWFHAQTDHMQRCRGKDAERVLRYLIRSEVAQELGVLIPTHMQRQDADGREKKGGSHLVHFHTSGIRDSVPLVSALVCCRAIHGGPLVQLQHSEQHVSKALRRSEQVKTCCFHRQRCASFRPKNRPVWLPIHDGWVLVWTQKLVPGRRLLSSRPPSLLFLLRVPARLLDFLCTCTPSQEDSTKMRAAGTIDVGASPVAPAPHVFLEVGHPGMENRAVWKCALNESKKQLTEVGVFSEPYSPICLARSVNHMVFKLLARQILLHTSQLLRLLIC